MPVVRDTVLIMTGRTQEGFMHSENIIYKKKRFSPMIRILFTKMK